jgi:hypothetical protein
VTTGATTRAPCSGLEGREPRGAVDTAQLTAPMAVRTRLSCFAVVIESEPHMVSGGVPWAGVERGVPGGCWAAGLGGDGDASAGGESVAQVLEPLGRCRPEPEGVDGDDGVEGAVEGGRQLFDRCPGQGGPSGLDGGGVAAARPGGASPGSAGGQGADQSRDTVLDSRFSVLGTHRVRRSGDVRVSDRPGARGEDRSREARQIADTLAAPIVGDLPLTFRPESAPVVARGDPTVVSPRS